MNERKRGRDSRDVSVDRERDRERDRDRESKRRRDGSGTDNGREVTYRTLLYGIFHLFVFFFFFLVCRDKNGLFMHDALFPDATQCSQ